MAGDGLKAWGCSARAALVMPAAGLGGRGLAKQRSAVDWPLNAERGRPNAKR